MCFCFIKAYDQNMVNKIIYASNFIILYLFTRKRSYRTQIIMFLAHTLNSIYLVIFFFKCGLRDKLYIYKTSEPCRS